MTSRSAYALNVDSLTEGDQITYWLTFACVRHWYFWQCSSKTDGEKVLSAYIFLSCFYCQHHVLFLYDRNRSKVGEWILWRLLFLWPQIGLVSLWASSLLWTLPVLSWNEIEVLKYIGNFSLVPKFLKYVGMYHVWVSNLFLCLWNHHILWSMLIWKGPLRGDYPPFNFDARSVLILKTTSSWSFFGSALISLANVLGQPCVHLANGAGFHLCH